MKKVFALLAVCGFVFAFVACGGKKEESTTTQDTVKTETPAAQDTAAQDTAKTDSTAAK